MKLASVVVAAMLCTTTLVHAEEAADARAALASARQRIEATDSRASGRLVQVDANAKRVSDAFVIKAHWFPGVLRVLLEIVPPRTAAEKGGQDGRVSMLFEMRPDGHNTIRVLHPHESAPASLPFSRWGESVFGSNFDYEDFLQSEYYWQDQTMLKSVRVGAHDCDVLKSTPSASDRSHYAAVQTWLDHTTGYPIYVEKRLKDAAAVKEFTSLGLTQSGGVWTARQVEVKIHGRPGSTLLIFERGSTKAHLTPKDFSLEQISRFEDHP